VVIKQFFEWQARWLTDRWDAEAQLFFWITVFWLCFPLYFAPLAFGGSWLTVFIFWLSVAALHLTAMTGITAAETLVETRTDPSLQEAVSGGASAHDDDGTDQGEVEAPTPAPETEGEARES
jgi:hypothetical protein